MNNIAVNPNIRFRHVRKFGICFFTLLPVYFFAVKRKNKINFTNIINLVIFTAIYRIMEHLRNIKIAVDFDGTIVEHEFPQIGKDMLFAFETLRELQKHGANLILWTFRSGVELNEAVDYCRKKGLEFYAVNRNYPEEVFDESISRKINADIFIDDRNVGGFPGWSLIWQELSQYGEMEKELEKRLGRRKSIIKKLFSGKSE